MFLGIPPECPNQIAPILQLVSRTRPPGFVPRTHETQSEIDQSMSLYHLQFRSICPFTAVLPRSLAAATAVAMSIVAQAQFVTSVVNYIPGTGYATEFGTGLGFTLTESLLGEPSRTIPGNFGGPVDPFTAPYLREQLLSVGTGGSVTVALTANNSPGNPYGLDFQVFGNTFFQISNGNYTGGGITDGTTFGDNSGVTRVSVSVDGTTFYLLNPHLAPTVDGLFPTSGSGDFQIPVNPSLKGVDFKGLDLTGIGLKYNISGGGTGYDISWAQNEKGQTVPLDQINFVRIDVVSGRSDLDAIASVRSVPEPANWALLAFGAAGLVCIQRRRAAAIRR